MAADGSIKISSELDSKGAEKGMSSLKDTVTNGAKIAASAVVAVGAALGAMAIAGLKATGELEQGLGGVEAVFDDFASVIKNVGVTAFKDMGLSMSDFLATANKMGALLQGMGFSIEESANISTAAMQRAADVASIMGIDVSSAMDAVSAAAKGNFTMMDNLGVAMNATALEAYALSKGIDKSYESMSTQEKIGLAMEMFLEKTAYAAGNYAKENDTLSGALNTAKAAMDNFMSGAGTAEDVADAFSNAIDVIIRSLEEIGPRLVEGLDVIANKLLPKIPAILDKALPIITSGAIKLIKSFSDTLLKNSRLLIDTARKIVNQLASAIGDAIPILKPFSAILELITKDTETFVAVLSGVGTAFIAFKAITSISSTITTLSAAFGAAALQVSLLAASQGAAAVTTMALNGTLTFTEVLVALVSGKITLATAAQWLWNAAMAANPVGLVAVAIGLLVTGIVLLTQHLGQQSEEWKNYEKTIEEFAESVDASIESIKHTAQAFDDSITAMKSEQNVITDLVNEIYALGAASNKTAEDKARLKLRIAELNELAPELGLSYDEVTDSLNMTREALDALIKSQFKQEEAAKIQDRLVEITRERAKIEAEMSKASDKAAEAQKRVTDATKDHTEAIKLDEKSIFNLKHGVAAANEIRKAEIGVLEEIEAKERELAAAYDVLGLEYEELTGQHIELTTSRADAAAAGAERELSAEEVRLQKLEEINARQTAIVSERIAAEEEYTTSLTEEANKWGMTLEEYKETIESLEEAEKERVEEVRAVYESITGIVLDAFQKISDSQKGALGFEEMTANLEHNAEVVGKWAENLDRLAKAGLDEGLIKQLRDAGPDSAGQVNKLADELGIGVDKVGTALDPLSSKAQEKLDALNKTLEANATLAREALEKSFDASEMDTALDTFVSQIETSVDTKFSNAKFDESGKYIPEGISKGIDDNASSVDDSVKNMSDNAYEQWRTSNEMHSPSRLYEKSAEGIPTGISQGIDNKKQSVIDSIKSVADDAHSAMEEAVRSLNFPDIGRAICDGIAQGISNNSGKIADAARQAALSAYNSAKAALEIKSPSKKGTALGENFGLSIGSGMEGVKQNVGNVAKQFVNTIYNAARKRMDTSAQSISESSPIARQISVESESTPGVTINNNNQWHVSKDVDVDRIMRIQQERNERQLRGKGVVLVT